MIVHAVVWVLSGVGVASYVGQALEYGCRVRVDRQYYLTPFEIPLNVGMHTFTADARCHEGVFYGWRIQGSIVSTRPSFRYNLQGVTYLDVLYRLPSYKVSFYVYDAVTRKPVVGAMVEIEPQLLDSQALFAGPTNTRGLLVIQLHKGNYKLSISREGYVPFETTINVNRAATFRFYMWHWVPL
jgi:hypothetical protein